MRDLVRACESLRSLRPLLLPPCVRAARYKPRMLATLAPLFATLTQRRLRCGVRTRAAALGCTRLPSGARGYPRVRVAPSCTGCPLVGKCPELGPTVFCQGCQRTKNSHAFNKRSHLHSDTLTSSDMSRSAWLFDSA